MVDQVVQLLLIHQDVSVPSKFIWMLRQIKNEKDYKNYFFTAKNSRSEPEYNLTIKLTLFRRNIQMIEGVFLS